MASTNPAILERVLEILNEEHHLDKNDDGAMWRRLVVGGIFRLEDLRTQFWVVDALDECNKYGTLVQNLSRLAANCPLRVFITCRYSPESDKLLYPLSGNVIAEQVLLEDTLRDIRTYLEAHKDHLPVDDEDARQQLMTTILEKSKGVFLWVQLVLHELEESYSLNETQRVLTELPQDMELLFERVLETLSHKERNKGLAKTILAWVTCSTRPLTTEELKIAVYLDTGDTLTRGIETSIPTLCGQLVSTDKTSRVQVIHQTVKDFLTKDGLSSAFAVPKEKTHQKLATICLRYLNGEELRPAKGRRKSSIIHSTSKLLFAEYACSSFSEHLIRSSSSTDSLLVLTAEFLERNVMSWIELVASTGNLRPLITAAKNFKTYLDRRAKYLSPLGQEVQITEAWASDLIHIVALFGKNLIACPTAIHSLIPPLCPSESAIYKQFGSAQRGLQVIGLNQRNWPDRLACIQHSVRTTSVACTYGHFAVGLNNGVIMLYYNTTFQETVQLSHGEPVTRLRFGSVSKTLVSSSRSRITIWDLASAQRVADINVSHEAMSLALDEDEGILIAATRNRQTHTWDLSTGSPIQTQPWYGIFGSKHPGAGPAPTGAEICEEMSLMAIFYRNRAVVLWDIKDNELLGQCVRPSGKNVSPSAVAFNRNPRHGLMAVAYHDGELAIFDPDERILKKIVIADAIILESSPDGRTLATGNFAGTLQIFDFESMQLLYKINLGDHNISCLAFSTDNLRLFDIRSQQCNVWEPSVLVRKHMEDDQSEPVSDLTAPPLIESAAKPFENQITILYTTVIRGNRKGSESKEKLEYLGTTAIAILR